MVKTLLNPAGILALSLVMLLAGKFVGSAQSADRSLPLHYIAYRTGDSLRIDGRLDEPCWRNAPWTEAFADIEGYHMPEPLHLTRAKILWDEHYLYIGAELEEPHIWATYTQNESVIFHENNFELFIDPDGDTHNYYELEINALGTRWDLMLIKPYRNGGPPINGWDITGMKIGIHHAGTINNPSDRDTLWSLEIALPWVILKEAAPRRRMPEPGDQWRINFSRVQWQRDVVGDEYVKRINPDTGNPFPEFNWIWSPMGLIDMHLPERWGFVQFSGIQSGKGTEPFIPHPDEPIKFALRELYHLQRQYYQTHRKYAHSVAELAPDGFSFSLPDFDPVFEVTSSRFMISALSKDRKSVWKITEDSRIWR
jgi:hypothetical protein